MPSRALISELKTRLAAKRPAATDLLRRFVAIPSVSGSEGEMQRELHALFSRLDGQSSLDPIPESLRMDPKFASGIDAPFAGRPQTRFYRPGAGGGRSLIACAHADVVKAGDWEKAFVPQIDGDRLIGRGAVDDKAMIVSLFLAAETLQEMGERLRGDLEFHFTNEEEVGMAGALAFVREGFRADGVLICEPTDHNIFIAHRGSLQFTVTVEGKQAHLGRKRYGVNAIEKAAKIVDALVKYEDRLIEEGRGYPLFESYEYPGQVNVGIIKGGDFFSIVPDLVTMEGGVGFLPNRAMTQVQAEIRELIAGIEDAWIKDHVTVGFNGMKNDPYEMPQGHPFTEALVDTLKHFDRTPKVLGMMATCDARYYYNQGGMASIVFGGMNNNQSHAKYEYAELPDILDTAAECAAFFVDWCGSV
jgi:acetylornithine deacetylase